MTIDRARDIASSAAADVYIALLKCGDKELRGSKPREIADASVVFFLEQLGFPLRVEDMA